MNEEEEQEYIIPRRIIRSMTKENILAHKYNF